MTPLTHTGQYKRVTLLAMVFILFATEAAHATILQRHGEKYDTNHATFVDTTQADRTIYYYANYTDRNGKQYAYELDYRHNDPDNPNYDDKFLPFGFNPHPVNVKREKTVKRGCKKRTPLGPLKMRLRNINCRNAGRLLNRRYCKNIPGRFNYECKRGSRMMRTEWAFKIITIKPDVPAVAWQRCGTYNYVKQYSVFSRDGSCKDALSLPAVFQADIIGSAMPLPFIRNGSVHRAGERIAFMPSSVYSSQARPADGTWNDASWFTFPNLSLMN